MEKNLCPPCPKKEETQVIGKRKLEKYVIKEENIFQTFITKLFSTKSTPYPRRFE